MGFVHLVGAQHCQVVVVGLVRVRLRRDQANALAYPMDMAVDRHERRAEAEEQDDRGGLLADARDRAEPVAGIQRRLAAEELQRVAAAVGEQCAQRGLDTGAFLRGESAGSNDVDQLGDRGSLHGRPVGRGQARQPLAAPAREVARLGSSALRYWCGWIGGSERRETRFGVGVGAVLSEDREDELAGWVQAVLPHRPTVDLGEAIEDERHQAGALLFELGGPFPSDLIRVRAPGAGLLGRRLGRRLGRYLGGRLGCRLGRQSGAHATGSGVARTERRSPTAVPSSTSRANRSPAAATTGQAWLIASASDIGWSSTGTASAPTAASAAIPSGVTPPPTARQGTSAMAARLATPRAVLPYAV